MKPITKLYLKVFLYTGITFWLTMSIVDLVFGNEFILSKYLLLAFFFGLLMSLILVSIQIYKLKEF